MIVSFLYVLLAILGLSVLIFFHELGHYYMAKRVGMRVETFAIGFGRPIYSWMHNGVKWQIGWLPFGGYVKIHGQGVDENKDPYSIPDGFFGKRPIDRIKVSAMGPIVNLALALIFFAIIWMTGGRAKNFSEFTHKMGWVDPASELYAAGVRPGDEILSYNNQAFQSFKDHIYAPLTSSEMLDIKGFKIDYATGHKQAFDYKIKPYPHPNSPDKGILTSGILSPANYLVYARLPSGKENPLMEGSPLAQSGIEYGDRILWVDGNLIFSSKELSYLLNDDRVLLTIIRDGKTLLMRVPRILVQELKMTPEFKEELMDWQYEANLNAIKIPKLYTIPYNLTNDGVVESELKFIDKDNEQEAFPAKPFAANEAKLLPRDRIVAINGTPVTTSYALLAELQQKRVSIIVERGIDISKKEPWGQSDAYFDKQINWAQLQKIVDSIGSEHPLKSAGNYYLLNPVAPKARGDFELSPETRALINADMLEQRKEIEAIEDPEKRAQALHMLNNQEKLLSLGLPAPQDLTVNYNPSPIAQFQSVFSEIWRTLVGLISGSLNPKWMSGPIGIVQVVHDNWMVGIKEALFWLGAISLNLGILNLLPIPVLDGGTIMLSLFEMVTRKKIQPKTMEKLVLPFALLLIAFFVFVTYHDLSRIFGKFLPW